MMKTLISSIPLIAIPNKREYSIEDIKEKLSDHYSISKRDDKTLEVSSSEFGTFYVRLSGGLRFLKAPPAAVKILFILSVLLFLVQTVMISTTGLFGYHMADYDFWGKVLAITAMVACFFLYQFFEIIYYSYNAMNHVQEIDEILEKLDLRR